MHLPVPSTNVAFSLFGIDVMWYGVMLTLGIILGSFLAYSRTERYGWQPKDRLLDMLLFAVPLSAIGARLYYVAFEWDYYSQHLDKILNFRGGGLAIHGALLFGILTGFVFCRIHKISFIKSVDMVAPGLSLGQAVGRWGNYFNQEAHGVATELPWGILIDGEYVHPTFLYESIWCLLLTIFLCKVITPRQKFDGQVFLLYAILYSAERFFVEGLRTDSLYIGTLRQAQVVSACTIVIGLILYCILAKKEYRSRAVIRLTIPKADR